MKTVTVVMGIIGSDIHVVGNKIIDFALREAGYEIVNLGIFSSQDDFINAAKETDAQVIIVSSLYGHAEMDCLGMRDKCIEAGLGNIKLYVGGNLVVGKADLEEVEKKFLAMGFDRVGTPKSTAEDIIAWLKADFGELK